MDEYKFLFVTCVNDEALHAICKYHIEQLTIPEGYNVEFLPIYGAKSMAQGYNLALDNDAKYKIYLHQDTFILNKFFLEDSLKLFKENQKLGLLGLVGCIGRPSSGKWTKGQLVGKWFVYKNTWTKEVKYKEVITPFEEVGLIDGFLMITQYDIPWRGDLFKGFHMYDSSQCMEFKKQGYLVGIPKQDSPWALHYMNHEIDNKEWDQYKEAFRSNYFNNKQNKKS